VKVKNKTASFADSFLFELFTVTVSVKYCLIFAYRTAVWKKQLCQMFKGK